MKVTVMHRNGWTYYPVTITIADTCPVCGGPRGEAHTHNYCEDGDWYVLDNWENPCGHRDLYRDVIEEAALLAADDAYNAAQLGAIEEE